jgi:site-specific DNA-cytosine methylase
VDGGRVRSLTVRELARAQAFRDSFQLPEDSPTLATKLVGNAVPPRLAEVVIRSMMDAA